MGALYKNVCYPTQDQARLEHCSQAGTSILVTTNMYTSECTSTVFTGATMSICKRTNGGACTVQTQPWPLTPACAHDGGVSLAYDWFIASIVFLVICWGGKKLIQLFDHEHNPT